MKILKSKVYKIDKPIREAIEITIIKFDVHEGAFEGHVAFEITFRSKIPEGFGTAREVNQIARFIEKLTATANGIHAALDTTVRISPKGQTATIKISHDVFTPHHLWAEVALPTCGLDPYLFDSNANVLVPSIEIGPNWDTSRDPA